MYQVSWDQDFYCNVSWYLLNISSFKFHAPEHSLEAKQFDFLPLVCAECYLCNVERGSTMFVLRLPLFLPDFGRIILSAAAC